MTYPVPEKAALPRTRPDRLMLARVAIIVITLLSTAAYIAGLVYYYQRLFIADDRLMAGSTLTIRQMHAYMNGAGLPVAFYVWISVIIMAALGLGYVTVALLLLWYKPKDRMATFTALILALFGTGFAPVFEFVADSFPRLEPLFHAWSVAGFTLLFILYLMFPDGRFFPRWMTIVAVFWVVENMIAEYWPTSPLALYNYPEPWGLLFVFLTLGFFMFAQVYRYFYVSDLLQRQQTRWVVIGLLVAVLAFPIPWTAELIWPQLSSTSPLGLLSDLFTTLVYGFAFLQIPISIGVAVSRYHLWDIDVLLRRTVLYTLLTVSLAVIYLVVVVLLQFLLDLFFQAGDSPLITVISTLSIAALFSPLRQRIQAGIDRRFFRRKEDTVRALSSFHARLQKDVDLHTLSQALNQVVIDSVQPRSVSVWIRQDPGDSPARRFASPGSISASSASDSFRNDFETFNR